MQQFESTIIEFRKKGQIKDLTLDIDDDMKNMLFYNTAFVLILVMINLYVSL